MKLMELTGKTCEQSQHIANLANLDHESFTRLTQDGPAFELGSIRISEFAFQYVISEYIWIALALHQCGAWGNCDQLEACENQLALDNLGGSVVFSSWCPEDSLEFSIQTEFHPLEPRTAVGLVSDSELCTDTAAWGVRLGDVQLDHSVVSVPYNRIWHALNEHAAGNTGDASEVFPPVHSGELALSWWSSEEYEFTYSSFFILTHVSEPRMTSVFAGSESS